MRPREFKRQVEILVSHTITNAPLGTAISEWLAGLPERMHEKLAKHGLVAPRQLKPTAPTLGEWLDTYLDQRTDVKPATRKALTRTQGLLVEHFGEARDIGTIMVAEAKEWRAWLQTLVTKRIINNEPVEQPITEASVRHHCRNAKLMLSEAVERELIGSNPFRKLISTVVAAERSRYVTPEETERILVACSDLNWRAMIALARLAGLRCPSETHTLTWADVDWDRARLNVRSVKTERHEKHRRRLVPIVPQLMHVLQDGFDAAPEGEPGIVALSRNNLHRTLRAILKRAEVTPFDRPYRVLRQSCETEWAQEFPQHAVSAWLGHSESVSRKHYLMVPDELFERAAKSAAVGSRTDSQGNANCGGAESEVRENDTENAACASANGDSAIAPPGTRTPDPLIKSQLLCQLS